MTPDDQRMLAMLKERSEQHARDLTDHGRRLSGLEERSMIAQSDRTRMLTNQERLFAAHEAMSAKLDSGMALLHEHTNDTKKISKPFNQQLWIGLGTMFGTALTVAAGGLVAVAKLFGWI